MAGLDNEVGEDFGEGGEGCGEVRRSSTEGVEKFAKVRGGESLGMERWGWRWRLMSRTEESWGGAEGVVGHYRFCC